ncbi:MAG: hypothetical protein JSU95_13670 [Betaproteobacteria bacterium]|nr:MAG: hypothetical protein JSU95_13670 [Betaproteobacteria bacterium]
MTVITISRQAFTASYSLLACATLLLLGFSADAFAHGVTFKYQDTQPANSAFVTNFVQPWSRKIYDESGGRINLLAAPRDAANAQTDLFQAVQDRSADIVWIDLQQSSASFPRFSVFALALEGTSSEGSSQALWWWVDMNDLAFREFKEMRILAASRHDAPVFHMRDKSVSSLSDLKDARIAIPNSDAGQFLTAIGAKPVVTSSSAIGTALAESSVDGVLLSWSSLAALGLEELVTTHAEAPANAPWPYAEVSVLLMNPSAYRGLIDDLKQVMRANSGSDISAWIGKTFDQNANAARERATRRGDTVSALPDDDLDKWREAASAAVNEGVGNLDAKGLKGERMVTKARALIAEHDPAN